MQCFLRSTRFGAPNIQPHSYADHLPHNLYFFRAMQQPAGSRRERMRLQQQAIAVLLAPAAGEALAGLNEVDRPLELRCRT